MQTGELDSDIVVSGVGVDQLEHAVEFLFSFSNLHILVDVILYRVKFCLEPFHWYSLEEMNSQHF